VTQYQRILLTACLLLTACTAPPVRPEESPAPSFSAPQLDGTLSAGEWDTAQVERFADGSELLLMRMDGALYLGVRAAGEDMIAANIFLDLNGEVRILHISAALGTAVYVEGENGWTLTRDFEWCCRETFESDAAQAARDALLAGEGWTSVNSRVGAPDELEVRIDIPGVQRLAVNILRSSQPDVKMPWPVELTDDVLLPTPGGLPAVLQFQPDTWWALLPN